MLSHGRSLSSRVQFLLHCLFDQYICHLCALGFEREVVHGCSGEVAGLGFAEERRTRKSFSTFFSPHPTIHPCLQPRSKHGVQRSHPPVAASSRIGALKCSSCIHRSFCFESIVWIFFCSADSGSDSDWWFQGSSRRQKTLTIFQKRRFARHLTRGH